MPIRHGVIEHLCIGPRHGRVACSFLHLLCSRLAVWPAFREEAMTLPRREFLQLAAAAAALPAMSHVAQGQTYPTRPVHVIEGFGAGGAVDVIARLISQWLSERLGQPFVVENRTGASSNIAAEAVVRASPDGYTLLLVTVQHAVNPAVLKLNFDFVRDIRPVAS